MNKYISWIFSNVDDEIISLSILEIDEINLSSSTSPLFINWKVANPKILAAHNKKRLIGALAENEYYIDNINDHYIFNSKSLACKNLIEFVFTTNGTFLKEKS